MDTPLATLLYVSLLLLSTSISCNKKEAQTTHAPVSVEALATQSTQRLLAQPEVKKALEEQPQGVTDEALDRLVRRGWKRLSDEQLFQRVALRRKILSSTDVTSCAAVVRDKVSPSQLHSALAKLEATDIRMFFTLKEIAVLAEAKNQRPPKMVLQDQFPEAFGALLKTLPPEHAGHLGELLTGDPSRASDDDICWAEKTFLDALLTTHEPYRSILARAVVQ
jgi:hypothetical protein